MIMTVTTLDKLTIFWENKFHNNEQAKLKCAFISKLNTYIEKVNQDLIYVKPILGCEQAGLTFAKLSTARAPNLTPH